MGGFDTFDEEKITLPKKHWHSTMARKTKNRKIGDNGLK